MRHIWSAAPGTQNDDRDLQNAAPATKTAIHLAKTSQKYCACHTKRLSTRYKTRLNVTKCHPCHTKRSNATFANWPLLQNLPAAHKTTQDLAGLHDMKVSCCVDSSAFWAASEPRRKTHSNKTFGFDPQKGFSTSFSSLNYVCPTSCKNVLKVFPLKSFNCIVYSPKSSCKRSWKKVSSKSKKLRPSSL